MTEDKEYDSENDPEFQNIDHGVLLLCIIICFVILTLAGSGVWLVLYLLGFIKD